CLQYSDSPTWTF
nr:immunoglobulin light chain junction region [Macaca mulatta]MOW08108.1 immunoglobulin light chain junction region [Macaca mulatta]MOW08414.1 immunoglobulin light chain junction region [Macaca mulatta]MOW09288.1 immunoglobulin light chain junction region [Macaca mulatta]MOW09338.1 immunoglobulin light chain junction region [Macaca mulatta]